MRRHWFPKPYADCVARLRVPAGFLVAALWAWLADPTPGSLAVGLPLGALGILIRAWAAGHLAKNERLATTGPYALVRNPLYAGTLVAAAGLLVAARRPWLAPVFAAVFAFLYLPVIEQEEQHLRKLFRDYEAYAARVPLLVPNSFRIPPCRFRWDLYLRNREYEALAAFLAGTALLVWRAWG